MHRALEDSGKARRVQGGAERCEMVRRFLIWKKSNHKHAKHL